MSDKSKLYQFIPDIAQSLKPAKMIIAGKARTFNPDGSVNEGTNIKLKPNAALQYFLPENHPDFDEAVIKMKRKIEKRNIKFGKGKPGSIIEIALDRVEERIEKDDDGKDVKVKVTVSNIGNIPDKYVPKTAEQNLRTRVAELESALATAGVSDELENLKAELAQKDDEAAKALETSQAAGAEKDKKIAALLAEIAEGKKQS